MITHRILRPVEGQLLRLREVSIAWVLPTQQVIVPQELQVSSRHIVPTRAHQLVRRKVAPGLRPGSSTLMLRGAVIKILSARVPMNCPSCSRDVFLVASRFIRRMYASFVLTHRSSSWPGSSKKRRRPDDFLSRNGRRKNPASRTRAARCRSSRPRLSPNQGQVLDDAVVASHAWVTILFANRHSRLHPLLERPMFW